MKKNFQKGWGFVTGVPSNLTKRFHTEINPELSPFLKDNELQKTVSRFYSNAKEGVLLEIVGELDAKKIIHEVQENSHIIQIFSKKDEIVLLNYHLGEQTLNKVAGVSLKYCEEFSAFGEYVEKELDKNIVKLTHIYPPKTITEGKRQLKTIQFTPHPSYGLTAVNLGIEVDDIPQPDLAYNGFVVNKGKQEVPITPKQFIDYFETLLKTNDSGLVLFQGSPGVGKTRLEQLLFANYADKNYNNPIIRFSSENLKSTDLFVSKIREIGSTRQCIVWMPDADNLFSKDYARNRDWILSLIDDTGTKCILVADANIAVESLDPALKREGRLLTFQKFEPLQMEKARQFARTIPNFRAAEFEANEAGNEAITLAKLYSYVPSPKETIWEEFWNRIN